MVVTKICPNCKNAFECDEDVSCWCMNVTKVSGIENDKDCFCKKCLMEKYKAKIFKTTETTTK